MPLRQDVVLDMILSRFTYQPSGGGVESIDIYFLNRNLITAGIAVMMRIL